MRPLDALRELTVLYVEDDPLLRAQMESLLAGIFQQVRLADNGAAGLACFRRERVDLVITDLRMPDMDGMAMAAEIRQLDAKIPILITSAYAETDDLLTAVRMHLVDYLVKPLSWDKLKAALENAARQILESGRSLVKVSPEVWFCPSSGRLLQQGVELVLTVKEKDLLDLLVAHRGSMVSKERIFQQVYASHDHATDSALKNLVMKLRRKIGDEVIVNSYGSGYMLRSQDGNGNAS